MQRRTSYRLSTLLTAHVLFVAVFAGLYYLPDTPIVVQRLNNGRVVPYEDPYGQFEELKELAKQRSPRDARAWAQLQKGVTLWHSFQKSKAVSQWRAVAQHYPDTEPAYCALANIGHSFRDAGNIDSAIKMYQAAIDVEFPQGAHRKHYVCINLSQAHLERQNLNEAIKFARLARHTYQAFTFCGLCQDLEDSRMDRYIERIQLAQNEGRAARLESVKEWNDRMESQTSASLASE